MAANPLTEPLSGPGYVKIGPFLSVTDGKTPMTELSLMHTDVRLSKNNGTFAPKNEITVPAHDAGGWYNVILDGSDLNEGYNGQLLISISVAGALPVWRKFSVDVPAGPA